MDFAKLIQFSRLVSDSETSERVFSLLGETVVETCGALHALIFGTSATGDFTLLSSFGGDDTDLSKLDLDGVGSVAELRSTVLRICNRADYNVRAFPLISQSGLFGALLVLHSDSKSLTHWQWSLVEGLTELTAISLNKTYQHQKLQKAFDDLRISQDALIRTEKFRALGQMSAGIAHDLKNLLNPLVLYADLLCDAANDRDKVLDIAHRMDRILTRGLETVERLRDFSRLAPEETEAIPTNLNSMVREAIEISKPKLGRINLVLGLGNPPVILVRPADCITAIVNFLFNAIDALEGRGTLTVQTGTSDGGGWVEIQDDGPGIPQEIKSRILEPFFTTKGDAGTGLGLSIVYAFTQRHGGQLEIESEPGHGARFRMWFPAFEERGAVEQSQSK